ncbi:MAG: hypothetical protein H0V89_03070, partial [Deltaproteobacteria bacterium]|nr:hypothetical protein [Deltaproteobacteria bacterium]
LDYEPAKMHRAKSPALFEAPKVVVQRIRQSGPVKAEVDLTGVYVGHTCSVVVPREVTLAAVTALLTDPLAAGLLRIASGLRLDLYPHDLAELPFPRSWIAGDDVALGDAWGLDPEQSARLRVLAATARLQ